MVLGTEPVQLGRLSQAGLRCWVLDHPEVSRAHARVEPTNEGFIVRDLQSHNGTFVNGKPVDAGLLADGDVLRIGSHLLLYQVLTARECDLLLHSQRWPEPSLVGGGARMLAVREAIAHAARSAGPVLVTGESGVGKELVATAIHRQSGRRGRLVAVNCAALPHALIESELFGHARGAFTGAAQTQAGLFEEAEGGTLLLDEIGDMPREVQAKLLRALAEGEIRPVGTTRAKQVDVKLVAATNVDLAAAVRAGAFRGDLYSRLLGLPIEVPALRRRREDIPELTRSFLQRAGAAAQLDTDAVEALLAHDWPFNVRELQQTVTLAADLGDRSGLRLSLLPEALRERVTRVETASAAPSLNPDPLRHIARDAVPGRSELTAVLQHFQGNVKRAAAFFGRDRRFIYRCCEQHGITPDAFRE
jgi:DNA-binding NtrC family response regulator